MDASFLTSPLDNMIPSYFIYRDMKPGEPVDLTAPPIFVPPLGSDELFDALRIAFPHVRSHSARVREAHIAFLMEERAAEQVPSLTPTAFSADASPSWESLPSSSSSFGNTPEMYPIDSFFMDDASPASTSTTTKITKNEPMYIFPDSTPPISQMTGVFSLSSAPRPKERVRRRMTEAERAAYRQRRLVKACDHCAKRKRKCLHNQPKSKPAEAASSQPHTRTLKPLLPSPAKPLSLPSTSHDQPEPEPPFGENDDDDLDQFIHFNAAGPPYQDVLLDAPLFDDQYAYEHVLPQTDRGNTLNSGALSAFDALSVAGAVVAASSNAGSIIDASLEPSPEPAHEAIGYGLGIEPRGFTTGSRNTPDTGKHPVLRRCGDHQGHDLITRPNGGLVPRSPADYTVAWICSLPVEMSAARLLLDEVHEGVPLPSSAQATYTFGRIGNHNIVIACGSPGLTTIPTWLSTDFRIQEVKTIFPNLKVGLLLGAIRPPHITDTYLQLGHVVVSDAFHRVSRLRAMLDDVMVNYSGDKARLKVRFAASLGDAVASGSGGGSGLRASLQEIVSSRPASESLFEADVMNVYNDAAWRDVEIIYDMSTHDHDDASPERMIHGQTAIGIDPKMTVYRRYARRLASASDSQLDQRDQHSAAPTSLGEDSIFDADLSTERFRLRRRIASPGEVDSRAGASARAHLLQVIPAEIESSTTHVLSAALRQSDVKETSHVSVKRSAAAVLRRSEEANAPALLPPNAIEGSATAGLPSDKPATLSAHASPTLLLRIPTSTATTTANESGALLATTAQPVLTIQDAVYVDRLSDHVRYRDHHGRPIAVNATSLGFGQAHGVMATHAIGAIAAVVPAAASSSGAEVSAAAVPARLVPAAAIATLWLANLGVVSDAYHKASIALASAVSCGYKQETVLEIAMRPLLVAC